MLLSSNVVVVVVVVVLVVLVLLVTEASGSIGERDGSRRSIISFLPLI